MVEDHEETLNFLSRALAAGGYDVLWARNSGDALKLVRKHDRRIDVVVTDVVLPDTVAVELVKKIKGRYPALRAIYVSAYDEETVRSHGVDPDRVPFLSKPFEPSDLVNVIHETLDRP